MAPASASPRASAQVLPHPAAANPAPVVNPKHRGRLPSNVIPLRMAREDRQGPQPTFSQILDLPFVADVKVPGSKRRTQRSFWHVPPATSYKAACDDGVFFACSYLIHLSYGRTTGFLGHILRDMQANMPPEGDAARGYQVGFCAEIDRRLRKGWGDV